MRHVFKPSGVCSRSIEIEMENGIVGDVQFIGGCAGNALGLAAMVKGCKAEDVISRLQGIRCGMKSTSCPDQLTKALEEMIELK